MIDIKCKVGRKGGREGLLKVKEGPQTDSATTEEEELMSFKPRAPPSIIIFPIPKIALANFFNTISVCVDFDLIDP